MPTYWNVIVARIRAYFRADDLDREFAEELETHLAMAEEEKIRQGMAPEQARRAARLELGGLPQLREAGHEARGLPWLDTFWLDIKLGLRMLRKSWGLTVVGGLAMTLAIGVGVLLFSFFDLAFGGTLPLEQGDRVVAIQTWAAKAQRRSEIAAQDLERWREDLRSVEEVGAFQTVERKLAIGIDVEPSYGPAEPVQVAEITASGFQLTRVAALLGRTLADEDQLDSALPVVVIGYEVWQKRFAADPKVVGEIIRFDDTAHTVVGVMPEGFAFPINHRFWTPLRMERGDALPPAPHAAVFGRLAGGASLKRAQVEVATLGLLPAVEIRPDDDEEFQARVVPYTFAFTGDAERGQVRWLVRIVLLFVVLLLIPPCANVAILVYARTLTRQEEFKARYSLGASRGRIVGQLFIEMLVLAAVAAAVALVFVHLAVGWAETHMLDSAAGGTPFWMDFTLSFRAVLFAAGLAGIAALIAGLVPALKATGRQMRTGLQGLGNRTGVHLGATWTALVVIQVALCLAALPLVIELTWGTIREGVMGPGFDAGKYLTARLQTETDPSVSAAADGMVWDELLRRLEDEPGVTGVTVASLPGAEPWQLVEVDGRALPEGGIFSSQNLVQVNQVDDAFLEVFEMPLLSGRGFDAGDFVTDHRAVIVNRTFAQQLLGADNPLGRQLRVAQARSEGAAADTPWHEVVGVIADRPGNVNRGTVYFPLDPAEQVGLTSMAFALRVAGDPVAMADRLRQITTELDPSWRLDEVLTLDEIYREEQVGNNIGASSLAAVTLSVLLLSAAGMYALMSFTINQRRREIGIRSALGAQPQRLLASVLRRALAQLTAGAAGGVGVALLLDHYFPAEVFGGWSIPGIIPAAALFMLLVGLLATAGPARRGLRVDPIEELRQG